MAEKKEKEKKDDPIIRNYDGVIEKILNETAGRVDRGIPCLISEPQWGKTYTVMKWARENDYNPIRLLCQTMEPEAIMGYDVKHPTTGELVWAAPSWLRPILKEPKKKWLVFLDELDKAREAVLSTLLTLLCDKVVQNVTLPQTVALVAAMNPARAPLPPALIERLLFIKYPLDGTDLGEGLKKLRSIAREYLEVPKCEFPKHVKNKGCVHRLENWADSSEFWTNDAFRHTIITGLVPIKDVAWWQNKLDPKAFMGVDLTAWAENAKPSDIKDSLIDILNNEKDQQKRYDVLKVLCDRANADPSGEVAQVLSKVAERMHEVS